MNTEPVKTTIRGIENTVTGAATAVTAFAAVVQAFFIFVNSLPGWLGLDLNPGDPNLMTIPDSVAQSVVALITVAAVWWVTWRSKKSIRSAGEDLREDVTPWDPEIGAMTPAPSQPISQDPNAAAG